MNIFLILTTGFSMYVAVKNNVEKAEYEQLVRKKIILKILISKAFTRSINKKLDNNKKEALHFSNHVIPN